MVICYIYKKGGNVMSNYKNPHRYKNGDNLQTEYYHVESWIAESL